ncbi:tetratricopeptide repeat protein, partial [Dokdonella sp.]|uniref:tetratricopeptide repeat protein n=1 Tax=Dokdonella sp. TaxID=2291710 RepID=UPI003C6B0F09
RNAVAAGLTTLALGALIAGLAVALIQRDIARTETRKSERVLEFMVDNFRLANPSKTNGVQISARDLLDRSAERMDQALADVPSAHADLLDAMSGAYAGLGAYDQSLQLADDAITIRHRLDEAVSLAHSLMLRAAALKSLTRNSESAATLAEARTLLPEMPDTDEASAIKAKMLSLGALLHWIEGEYEPAREGWTNSLALYRQLYGTLDERSIETALFLSRALASQKKFDASLRLLNEIIEPIRSATPPRPARLHESLNALGGVQLKRGDNAGSEATHREAAQLAEQVYGPEHFFVAVELHNVGKAMLNQNHPAEAIEPLRRGLGVAHVALPPSHGLTASIIMNLALAEADSGDCGMAQVHHEELLNLLKQNPEARNVDPERTSERIRLCRERLATEG